MKRLIKSVFSNRTSVNKLTSGIHALLIVLVITVFTLPFGCAREPKEIRIGILAPLTGNVASWGDMQRRSTELALAEINATGGIHGDSLKVIYEDTKAEPMLGVNAFIKLAGVDRVPIVIGAPASNVTLAIAPVANQKKIVLLSSGSTAIDVGKAGPYVFRIMPSDEVQSSIMVDWVWELGYRKIAVIYVENSWGRGLMEAFIKDFKAESGVIVTTQAINEGDTDFRTQLLKIKSQKPDAIYAPLYTRGAGLMIKQARELGLHQQILGADVYGTPELIEAGGDAVNGILYTTFGEYHGPEYQDFAKRYKEEYEIDVETYATYCYDAFMITVEAIKRIPQGSEINSFNIREELLKIKNYHGVTGLTTFDGRTSAIGKTFDKMTVKNGKHLPFEK